MIGGTIALTGRLVVRADKVGADTQLAHLIAMIEQAQAGIQRLAGWDGVVRGGFAVTDAVKPSAAPAVARLRALGLRPVLLTGDNAATAQAVGACAGIGEVLSEALPPPRPGWWRNCRGKVVRSPWSGTGSTTVRPSRRPAWGWPWARAPTWPSARSP